MTTDFGWSLPPGCSSVPGDEPLPPCCEDCPEDIYDNCPGEDECAEFQKLMQDKDDMDRQTYGDCVDDNYKEARK